MLNKQETINKIPVGERITIFYKDPITSNPVVLNCTLNKLQFGKYAQHDSATYFNIKIKGKRSNTLLILADTAFVILKGWIKDKGYNEEVISKSKDVTMSKMLFKCVDDYKNHKDLILIKGNKEEFDHAEIPQENIYNTNGNFMRFLKENNISSCAGLLC